MKKVGVVLSGCGYLDGSEIQEATLTLLALDQANATIVPIAPNAEQMHVVEHMQGEPEANATRSVFAESARITRGELTDLSSIHAADLDALILPGGYGVAKNLSTFAVDGTNMQVNASLSELIRTMYAAKKPMGFICIAPAIAAKVLGEMKPQLTIGNDEATANALQTLGATHVECTVEQTVVDEANKIVSTPAYMIGPSIAPVAKGIEQLVHQVLEMC